MGGRVVQGLRGERRRYRAVDSTLVHGCEPLAVARALCRVSEGKIVYVADLDAITGAGDHGEAIRELRTRLGVEPWVDAGVGDAETASLIAQNGAARVIVGTETLTDLSSLAAIRTAVLPTEPLVSVDVGDDGVLSRCRELAGRPPLDALGRLAAEGVTEVILLALTRVGTATGPDLPTLRAARAAFPGLRLIAGGGVRTPDDLRRLAETGADGVLLATALHRGWITAADVRAVRSSHGKLTSEP